MIQPDLFGEAPAAVEIGARTKRSFRPRPLAENHRRFLGHCPVKKCPTCRAHDVSMIEEERERQPPGGSLFWPAGQLNEWRQRAGGKYKVKTPRLAELPDAKCPAHGYTLTWRPIEGSISEKTKCDPRCTSAHGPVCVCQCGGANHSSDHL